MSDLNTGPTIFEWFYVVAYLEYVQFANFKTTLNIALAQNNIYTIKLNAFLLQFMT